ncbi:hypothetical protein Scep_003891 [Stephania cephalantha]|uniref:Pentatricopeptide repeat-containing protein n=1 Tax=Stephania cephalantha TaxID=152367 RepID=A0AAP0KRD7_9MAGN
MATQPLLSQNSHRPPLNPNLPKSNNNHRANPTFRTRISCKQRSAEGVWEERKVGFVDYDEGKRGVSVEISGLRKDDLPKRYRLRVHGDRWQRDWAISQVVGKVLELEHWEDVEGVLNRWVGRFARKNFPVLIREITNAGSLEHSVQVFCWMKNQKNYCARTDIYNMMIRLHARHSRTDHARGLFFEMQEWRCKPDAETYNALINAHGRAGQWRWAMNIMDEMLRAAIAPSRSTYNNLINACGSSGHWQEALKVCKKMTENGVGPDLVTHNIVLSAYKNGGQYSKALSYFELMKGTNIRPDTVTFNIVIYCLTKLGEYGKASDIFCLMRDKRSESPPDTVTFTTMIHLYSACGQIENCKAMFDMMLAEGFRPNIVTYNALVGAYASHGMHNEALTVFNELKSVGIRPDVVSYTSLLNSYGRSRQPEKARQIFEKMKQNSCKPNLVCYNALIDAYGSEGRLAEALQVLREMERNGLQPNVVTICTFLASCGRCGQTVKIESILSAAEARGIELNTVAYNSAISSYMNQGDYGKGLSLYKTMRRKRVKPDSATFNILISGSCKMGRYHGSLKFLDDMRDLKIASSKEVCSSAICAYTKLASGQVAEAESMFHMMKTDGCCPDVVTYTSMIQAYNAAEDWERAWGLFEDMEANGIQPDTIACSSLMKAFNKGGQPARVIVMEQFMRDKTIPFSEATVFEILSACSMLRDWRTAIDLIETAEPLLSVFSVGLLNQALNLIGKSGKIEIMMKLFYKMVSLGAYLNNETYSILLKNIQSVGKWRKYIEVLQWMEDTGTQLSIEMYNSISSTAWKGWTKEHTQLIQEKLECLKKQVGIATRTYAPAKVSSSG